jgi:hypothetical protein
LAKKRLGEAKHALAADSSKEFYALLFKAVTEYIADKLNLPSAVVTSQSVSDLLGERHVDAKIIAETADCLWECEHGRFSAEGKKGGWDFLKTTAALLRKLERAIR